MIKPTGPLFEWFFSTFALHVRLHFNEEAAAAIRAVPVRPCLFADVRDDAPMAVLLPVDIQPSFAGEFVKIPFEDGRAVLPLPQAIPAPAGQWRSIEVGGRTLWWSGRNGALVPAWNLYGVSVALLTMDEERRSTVHDGHGRFPSSASVRAECGLLHQPTVNHAFALLVAAASALHQRHNRYASVEALRRPPLLFLSHDCDNLLGSNIWLQLSRIRRFCAGFKSAPRSSVIHLKCILRDVASPYRYFRDDISRFMEAEERLGYFSRFYFLNGRQGRHHARAGRHETSAAIRLVHPPHEVGIHYNYDTHLNAGRLRKQVEELQHLAEKPINAGRAHYLRFDARESPLIWESAGLGLDETIGYADRVGYRMGFAGVLRLFEPKQERPLSLLACPLIAMDSCLLTEFPRDVVGGFRGVAEHIALVGGSLSLLMHPGYFDNPEFPEFQGLYGRLLAVCQAIRARQVSTEELLKITANSAPEARWVHNPM